MAPQSIVLDRDLILATAREVAATEPVPSRTKVANRLGLVASTMNKALDREGWTSEVDAILAKRPAIQPEPGGIVQAAGKPTEITSPPTDCPWTQEGLLKHFGFSVDEWKVTDAKLNKWGDTEDPRWQLKLTVVPVGGIIKFPDPNEWTPPPKPKKRKQGGVRKVVICGDHHCPYVDWTLHGLFLEFLADEQPDEGVILGDLLDLSGISRHRRGKKKAPAEINEELRCALKVLQDYRHASPDTHWTLLPGNHDDRIDHLQIDNAHGIYGVAPGGGVTLEGEKDEAPALAVRRLLYLDELGIDYIFEDWNRAKHLLGRKLTLRHGYLSGKNASDNMLKKITRSTIQGHTHRMRFIYKTEHDEHDEDQPTATRLAAEAGCMAEIKDSLGYGDEEDWQQGFLLAHLWEDGDFTLAPVPYVPGRLLAPSGKRYR